MPRSKNSPDIVLLDLAELKSAFGLNLSDATVRRMVKAGSLPRPVHTGVAPNAKRFWHKHEVAAAIASWPRGAAA